MVDLPASAVLGRPFRCHITTNDVLAWLDRHWWRDEHATTPYTYAVELVEESGAADAGVPSEGVGAPGRDAGWQSHVVRLPDGVDLCWAHRGDEWVWHDGAARVRLRLAQDGARIRFRYGAGVFPALYVAVSEALRASGLLPVHAAVVVRDGHATALAGPSGTGKTTTLLRLLRRGWRPLAEDLSWLDPATGTLHGWDRGLRLWQDGLERLGQTLERMSPELAAAAWSTDPDGKRFLAWDALGVERVPRARLTRVVLLERDAARPTCLEPLAPRDAVRVLWEATGVPLSAEVRAMVSVHVARMARELEFSRLRLGPDSEAELPTLVAL